MQPYCVFCNIVAGREPGNIVYQDDEVIVIQNILRWFPIMLLAMTKKHSHVHILGGTFLGHYAG